MQYAIDINPLTDPFLRGPGQYTKRLVLAMMDEPLFSDEEVILYSKFGLPLAQGFSNLPPGWSHRRLRWPLKHFFTQARIGAETFFHPPNALFVPARAMPILHPHNKKKSRATVVTIHDAGFQRFPRVYAGKERRYLERTTRFAVCHAEKIFVPSLFTKQELLHLYRAKEEQVMVTPLAPTVGARPSEERVNEARRTFGLTTHTILSVGSLETKKNIETLLKGFEAFKLRRGVGDPFQLVLAGAPGFGFPAIHSLMERSSVSEAIHRLGFVGEEDLRAILAGAFAYVSPAWYEGFGLAALDAMSFGIPLLASDIPAVREVAGEAGKYFSPSDPLELARLMTLLAEDEGERSLMARYSQERAKLFSWKATAQLTWKALRESVS
jgi:glycosyltransferase involved in cell wall biosynthesis